MCYKHTFINAVNEESKIIADILELGEQKSYI